MSFKKEQDDSLSVTLSDLVLKRCKDQTSSQGDRKKLQRIRTKLERLVCEKDIRDKAEKKGRKALESDFCEDDPSSLKSSSTPPLKVGACPTSDTMETEKAIFYLLPRQSS